MSQYSSINIQGQILSTEILEKLGKETTKYQKPEDYGLKPKESLRDEIQFAYSLARQQWEIFKKKQSRWEDSNTGTSDTRNYWMLPFFDSLGYELSFEKAETVNNRSYNISHRDVNRGMFPVHIMSTKDDMDKKRDYGGPRLSPHGLLQEYLNVTEHLFGLATNGLKLRVLRDSTRLSRLSYIEFDLEAMMEDELYTDFAVMFRLIHASRMPTKPEESPDSFIEAYHQDAIESGARIREKLREKVEISLKNLGNGFLIHPDNDELRQLFIDDEFDSSQYYSKLLKIIYRLLFLMVSEERNVIYPQIDNLDWDAELLREYRSVYREYYSIDRLRRLAEKKHQLNTDNEDLWESLKRTFSLFEKEALGERLGIQALDGELFSPSALDPLNDCRLTNHVLLKSLDAIARFENENGQLTRVNYGGLDVEEFGSVYEALLDYEPKVKQGQLVDQTSEWAFQFAEGTERKSTGSYYTRTELVQELIKSALVPVIEERLQDANGKEDKEQALLDLKICDPAAGSGHFLLAAARKIAEYVAEVRTGEEQPPPDAYRKALREVIQHCIYGVDMNPMAVELCKVALWLESHSVGYPLTFLDHHIKCGNSLIGLDNIERLNKGIQDGAFKEVIGDEKKIARKLKKRNQTERKAGKQTAFQETVGSGIQALDWFAERSREIDAMPEQSVPDIRQKDKAYNQFKKDQRYLDALQAANIWAGAFFIEKTSETVKENLVPTTSRLHSYIADPRGAHARFTGTMNALAQEHGFFHWPLEFPEIYVEDGFDVVLGNPPWERIKLQEKEFFQGKDENIANAKNKAQRTRLIKKLNEENPALYDSYEQAKRFAEALSNFVRESSRYPLTAKGDINTYQLFSGLDRALIQPGGRAGFIVPTGIATDYYNEEFFGDVVDQKSILSLFDFENRDGLFEGVHRSYKFCLLTLGGEAYKNVEDLEAEFAFFLTHPNQLDDDLRRFKLTPEDLVRINPNTKTTPIFRTQPDAELTRKIYRNTPVLIRHEYDKKGKKTGEMNPWEVSFLRMFDMANDSDLFFDKSSSDRMPLYEAKYIWHFDHRFATYEEQPNGPLDTREVTVEEKQDPNYSIRPRYWVNERKVWSQLTKVPKQVSDVWKEGDVEAMKKYVGWWLYGYGEVYDSSIDYVTRIGLDQKAYFPGSDKEKEECREMAKELKLDEEDLNNLIDYNIDEAVGRIIKKYSPMWLSGWRDITNATNERTFIFSIYPVSGAGDTFLQLLCNHPKFVVLAGNLNSLIFDYFVRQKIGGTHLKYFTVKQLPIIHPNNIGRLSEEFIRKRVWELTYTSQDLKPFAQSLGYDGDPFIWDEERRSLLKAELDAYYALLYGLTEKELRYILDPEEVYGEDFPGETFRVLKNKEIRKYGEYRTKNLVMEAWKRLEEGLPMMSESKLRLVKSAKEASKEALKEREGHKIVRLNLRSRYDAQRGVMMKAIEKHSKDPKTASTLGKTKIEKINHTVEGYTGLDFGRTAERLNYGPIDYSTLESVHARSKQCFTYMETSKQYYKGIHFDFELADFEEKFGSHPEIKEDVERIIDLFLNLDREESEVIATVFAAWNDLLLEGKIPDEEMIVREARENWHPEKLKIERNKFFEAIEWLVQNDLTPKGVGKHTVRKSSPSDFVHSIQKNVDMKEFGLHEGIYSINDAAPITQLSYDKVRRWFRELMEAQYEGLTGAEKKDLDKLRISFHGVIELVVIGTLRDNGFTLRKILQAREDLANKTGKKYPFATNNIRDRLKVAGKSIIFELPNGDMVTLDGTGQYNLEIIRQFFRDIEFNTEGVATRILPTKGSKLIVIDPKEGGGKPVIKGKGVWVESIVKAYSGPESKDVLIDQYNLEEKEIQAALDYSDSYQN